MRNSRTSSIVSASKNLRWDGVEVELTEVFGAAAFDQQMDAAAVVFPGSRMLGRSTNPSNNKGLVHLIHQIVIGVRVTANLAVASHVMLALQLRRRNPGAGQPNSIMFESGNVIDELIAEFPIIRNADIATTGTPGSMLFSLVPKEPSYEFAEPLVAVEPYYAKVTGVGSAAGAVTVTTKVFAYLLVESIRVQSEAYRRLLDAYTQMPS